LGPAEALEGSYAEGITDEFLEPVRLAEGLLESGDGLVCFNFRPDRVRQLMRALVLPDFDGFPVFSPSGRYLVFASNRYSAKEGETNVFVAEWVD
jgi:bisphosphoglycerate-independent phosphoglycerate mutase (AlkP superfamily)